MPRVFMTILGDASAKIPWPNEISELAREFPSRNLCKGGESRVRVSVDQEK